MVIVAPLSGGNFYDILVFVCCLLATGAAMSPFNAFLRRKYFEDGYEWSGLNKRATVPLLRTLGMVVTCLAGVVFGLYHLSLFADFFVLGMVVHAAFPVWQKLRRRRNNQVS